MSMASIEKVNHRIEQANSLVCVGLDSDRTKLPERFKDSPTPQFDFNRWIIEQTHSYVAAYKPNIAFYEASGTEGLRDLKLTMEYLQTNHPDILTICDAKRGDNGLSNTGYVASIFDWLGFDAVTLHSYLGQETLRPFLDRADKACIILCRTSNPGAGEFQDLTTSDGKPLWQIVAEHVSTVWNTNNNCMLVAGATYPQELGQIRQVVGDMPLLVPGIGAQGGDIAEVVPVGIDSQRRGLIISSSRGIIFSDDPAQATRQLRDEINQYR